jgi:hypothetical protein
MLSGPIEEVATQAEKVLLSSITGEAFCVAQEWAQRVDCWVRLPDGSLIGETIAVGALTESRVRETANRLQKRVEGLPIPLVDEIAPPVRLVQQSGSKASPGE